MRIMCDVPLGWGCNALPLGEITQRGSLADAYLECTSPACGSAVPQPRGSGNKVYSQCIWPRAAATMAPERVPRQCRRRRPDAVAGWAPSTAALCLDEGSIPTAAITAAIAPVLSRLIQRGFPAPGLGPPTRPLLLLWFENPCVLPQEPR